MNSTTVALFRMKTARAERLRAARMLARLRCASIGRHPAVTAAICITLR